MNQPGGQVALTRGRVLMTGITVVSPFTPYMPVVGDHRDLFDALNKIYLGVGEVFQMRVDEVLNFGVSVGRDEHALEHGFEDLAKFGMLNIGDDGVFTPTKLYLGHFFDGEVVESEQPSGRERI